MEDKIKRFIVQSHPCKLVVVLWVILLPLRIAGTLEGLLMLSLIADVGFIASAGLALFFLLKRRRPKGSSADFVCERCGVALDSELLLTGHLDWHKWHDN